MPIQHLELDSILASSSSADFSKRRKLEDLSTTIAKAKRVIVVSGAGISCSSGIPDFRSENGLYSLVKKRYPDTFVTGKDLFSSGLFSNPSTTSVFLTFIAELSLACQAATPTRTHHFIQKLDRTGKLLRSYTQNVDGFERRMGMESGGRGKGLSKAKSRNVELHGDLGRVRCCLCQMDYPSTEQYVEDYREGLMPDCPACEERCDERVKRGSRALAVGTLRPAIVLYDEPHPLGDQIGELQSHDLKKGPDVLLIMGTSLKVHGLKNLVKSFAKRIHEHENPKRRGIVVFVNQTKPGKEWEGVIDVHVQGETDKWVERVEEVWRRVKPGDWEVQTTLDGPVRAQVEVGSKAKTTPKKGKATKKGDPTLFTSGQLPTPRASRSPSCGAETVSSGLTDPPSPTPTLSPPLAPKMDSSASAPMSPPLSPSKRRANVQTPITSDSPVKRPRPPQTGTPPSEGRGNLFGAPKAVKAEIENREEDWEDEGQVEGMTVSMAKPGRPVRATRGKAREKEEERPAKENVPVKAALARSARNKAGTKKLAEEAVGVRRRGLRTLAAA